MSSFLLVKGLSTVMDVGKKDMSGHIIVKNATLISIQSVL
ncbi:hypothetical protein SLEP1_g32708 [Rubroshorea leprosula]|uniref:Uncharacterized protein n=1 Tax=Rubroshorea leprosula TaxID=152421 RepID=A0AAV5KE77_9ROSI|nr:hypothetical protein SLEP1_g32708 [Rubroshorea leprosula]